MKDNKGFWDRWAGRYDRFMSGDKDTYARIVNRMKKKLNRSMDVLELACGTGILSVQLAGNVKMLEATDFSEEMIKQAKQKCHSSRLHFSVQDATALPYAPETFDVVIISNALHIMPSPEKALAEEGYIFVDEAHEVHLTERGRRIAEETYERHNTFRQLLTGLCVDEKTAVKDACQMEHAVSRESYEALKRLADTGKI